ncbi:MAG TPA: DUF1295 domain-containing protein [Oscillatoriaceae cyanobacterium M33_DOE_052]|uniref:DUF1295 domain-containing protein n=1 Tax=Planktothricoides sp. SpSt-374 TaxID=2282167 RepID=A0A7C3VRH8_9CYAN|nr:DUF1295 domain-containing protein [Oscillatoriaceae cyanobacterium M33_DOE_052]
MKIKHPINLHKALTFPFVFSLMLIYDNFTIGPWVYLSLHGTYGILWLLKDRLYPDNSWEEDVPLVSVLFSFMLLSLYWVAPWLLISRGNIPPLPLIAAAIFLNLLGVFLVYTSDAQKYYTLKYQSGLITEGFFSRTRSPNYLGEIFIYTAFALLTQHWLPFAIIGLLTGVVFLPRMRQKDASLARYPEFDEYKNRSGLLLPKLFLPSANETQAKNPVSEPS